MLQKQTTSERYWRIQREERSAASGRDGKAIRPSVVHAAEVNYALSML